MLEQWGPVRVQGLAQCNLTVPQWLHIPGIPAAHLKHTWHVLGRHLEHTFQASSHWFVLVLLNQHQSHTRLLGEITLPDETQIPGWVKSTLHVPGTVPSTSHSLTHSIFTTCQLEAISSSGQELCPLLTLRVRAYD